MTNLIHGARCALITGALIAAAPGVLYAQSAAEQQGPPQVTAPAASGPIADAKVDQFASAFVAVQDIQAKATEELSAAKDDQQATQVKAAAEQKMIEAVKREGLEVEEFNRIADLMTTDMELRSKVVEKVERKRKG